MLNEEHPRSISAGPSRSGGGTWTDPVTLQAGMFNGKVMRFSLHVAQEPIHGRRKTEKDRRPLAHVPILRLRARECWPSRHREGWEEEDIDISAIDPTLLVCAAEISGMIDPSSSLPAFQTKDDPAAIGYETSDSRLLVDPTSRHHSHTPIDIDTSATLTPNSTGELEASRNMHTPMPTLKRSYDSWPPDPRGGGPGPSSLRNRANWTIDQEYQSPMQATAAQYDNDGGEHRSRIRSNRARRRRESKDDGGSNPNSSDDSDQEHRGSSSRSIKKMRNDSATRNLYGSLHVSGVRVPAPEGGLGLWFLFTDLCVRHEGTYALRFRCYDLSLLDKEQEEPVPPLAECYSQAFKVYSPRNFPGLPKQTDLSEHFARQGFKLNTRKNERHAPSPEPPQSNPGSGYEDGETNLPAHSHPHPHTQSQSQTQTHHRPSHRLKRTDPGERPQAQPIQHHPHSQMDSATPGAGGGSDPNTSARSHSSGTTGTSSRSSGGSSSVTAGSSRSIFTHSAQNTATTIATTTSGTTGTGTSGSGSLSFGSSGGGHLPTVPSPLWRTSTLDLSEKREDGLEKQEKYEKQEKQEKQVSGDQKQLQQHHSL